MKDGIYYDMKLDKIYEVTVWKHVGVIVIRDENSYVGFGKIEEKKNDWIVWICEL